MHKICTKCKQKKSKLEYYSHPLGKNGLRPSCKTCVLDEKREYDRLYKQKLRIKDGYGLYEVKFPSGKYIGCGQLQARRDMHLKGNSRIGKTLNERASNFNILLIGLSDYCREIESKYIKKLGLKTILNLQV